MPRPLFKSHIAAGSARRNVLITLFALAGVLATPAHAQTPTEAFEAVACATFKVESDDAECGYVRVPEFYDQPNARPIKLAVVLLKSTPGSSTREAFVMAQGGPGGSSIDTFARFMELGYFPALRRLRAERDIVLYDQRGTLYAQPSLVCTEDLELTERTIEEDIPPDEQLAQQIGAAEACHDRLVRKGVNLAAYNSRESARDVESLRRALGYEQFDYYGVSYGTLLALHVMRESPESLRSVILDAVVPTQINPNITVAQTMHAAFERLFTMCEADMDCHSAYPDLKTVFYSQVDALNQKAARVRVTDDDTNKTYHAVLNGDQLVSLLFQFIYNSELIPALPKMIDDLRAGQYTLIERFWGLLAFDRTFASGMYYSTMCSEDADFTPDELGLDSVDPHIAVVERRTTRGLLEVCNAWNVPPLGAAFDLPVASEVPTLLLSGDFDPITPPLFGRAAAERLQTRYLFEFPAYGHGALTSGDCPNQIIVNFVRAPQTAPNASCIAQVSRVPFITPHTMVMSPRLGAIMYAILDLKLQSLAVPAVLLALLGSVWIVGPISWLVQRVRQRAGDPRLAANLAPWFAAFAFVVAAGFAALLGVIAFSYVVNRENLLELLFGIPRSFEFVVWLPPLFAILAALLVGITMWAWRAGYWGAAFRVYMSVLAVAAVGVGVWYVLGK